MVVRHVDDPAAHGGRQHDVVEVVRADQEDIAVAEGVGEALHVEGQLEPALAAALPEGRRVQQDLLVLRDAELGRQGAALPLPGVLLALLGLDERVVARVAHPQQRPLLQLERPREGAHVVLGADQEAVEAVEGALLLGLLLAGLELPTPARRSPSA